MKANKSIFAIFLVIALSLSSTAYSQLSDTSRVFVQVRQLRQCLLVNDSLQIVKTQNAILSQSKARLEESNAIILKQQKKSTRRLKWANRYAILATVAIVVLVL